MPTISLLITLRTSLYFSIFTSIHLHLISFPIFHLNSLMSFPFSSSILSYPNEFLKFLSSLAQLTSNALTSCAFILNPYLP